MKKELVIATLAEAFFREKTRDAIPNSDRGGQYTSAKFREEIAKFWTSQSMNSAGGRCHDNAKREPMRARFKQEKIYGKHKTENISMGEVKNWVPRYFGAPGTIAEFAPLSAGCRQG